MTPPRGMGTPRFALAVLGAALLSIDCGQRPPPPYPAIAAEQIRTHAARLAEAEVAGAEAGGRGEQLAATYLTNAFTGMGLRVQQQQALLTKMTPTGSAMTLSGPGGSRVLRAGEDFVAWTNRHEPAVSADAELVFVGYGISLPRQGWDDYKGTDVRGRILLMRIGAPGSSERPLLGTAAEEYYGRPGYKFEEAARRGAAGVLLIHVNDRAEDTWGVIRRSSVDLLDVRQPAQSASYLAVEGWLNEEAARGLFADAGLTLDATMPLAEHANFAPVSLPVRAAIQVQSELTAVTSTNIVATLEGAGQAAEHVLYSAQWNSLPVGDGSRDDLTDTEAGDQPPPGAPVVLEVARALAGEPKLPRSFVFLVVTAESEGLAGLDYYLSHPVYPLTGMRAAIHLAGFSIKGPGHHLSIIGPSFPALKELVRQQAAEQFRVASPDPDPERVRFYGSGKATYRARTVPSVFLASWQASPAVPTAPAGSEDMSVAVLDAQLLFRVGRRVATAGNWPSRQITRTVPPWAAPVEARNQGQSKP